MQNQPQPSLFERLEVLTLQVEACLDEQKPEEMRAVLEARELVLQEVFALDSLSASEVSQLLRIQGDQQRIFDRMKLEQAECEKGLIHMYASRQGRRAYRQG